MLQGLRRACAVACARHSHASFSHSAAAGAPAWLICAFSNTSSLSSAAPAHAHAREHAAGTQLRRFAYAARQQKRAAQGRAAHAAGTAQGHRGAMEDDLLPRVALVGRPNVGKSALFNRLVRKRTALVYNTPLSHVTRDWQERAGQLGDLRFRVMDTSGMEPSLEQDSIQGRAAAITANALGKAHVTLMIIDAREGIITADEELAAWLHAAVPHPEHIILVANKAEGSKAQQNMDQTVADAWRLGFGEPVAVSASSGEGMADLFAAMEPHLDAWRHRLIIDALLHTPPSEAAIAAAAGTELTDGERSDDEGEEGGDDEGAATGRLPHYGGVLWPPTDAHTEAAADSSSVTPEQGGSHAAGVGAGVSQSLEQHHRQHYHQQQQQVQGDAGGSEGGETSLAVPEEHAALASGRDTIRLAIVGLPNVGKSTLLNTLLGEDRVLTGPEPGLTRDVVSAAFEHHGTRMELLDTAGYVGATKVSSYDDVGGDVAEIAREAALSAMASAHVIVLLLDVTAALRSQKVMNARELSLVSSYVLGNGKALVIAANKMDALPGKEEQKAYLDTLRGCLEERLLDAGIPPVVPLVARSGKNVQQLLDAVVQAHQDWDRRVSTGRLNRFLAKLTARISGAGGVAKDVARLKYLTQVKSRPPTFVAFMSGSTTVDDTFPRFLSGQLREALGMGGTPLRFWFRYKDPRTLQALEGTLPGRRRGPKTTQSGAAGAQKSSRRPRLPHRLLKPRLLMAQRARAAAAETHGLSSSMGEHDTQLLTPQRSAHAPQRVSAAAAAGDERVRAVAQEAADFFGHGGVNGVSGGTGSVSAVARGPPISSPTPSSAGSRASGGSARGGRPQHWVGLGGRPGGKRGKTDELMQRLARSPSAPLFPVGQSGKRKGGKR